MYAKLLNILPLLAAFGMSVAAAEPFPLTQQGVATIVHEDNKTLSLVASMLGRDLRNVAGVSTVSATNLADCRRLCIVVGSADSALVRDLARVGRVDLSPLRGQWERYVRTAVDDKSGRRILLIAGSDKRGALYGVVDLSRELGVSPWEWWADVAPARNDKAAVDGAWKLSAGPSVQYRGIFLNDEDWGLQPWAAGKDPTKDIGPTTYARIFELLWRLKANLIWPAMHDSTKPFYQIPGNARTAEDYAIVVGTSHAEPMMRNNVREWDAGRRGAFNFFNNRDAMLNYWQERVDEVKDYENIYSVGLRGVHDSAMEGADTIEKARSATGEVIGLQRNMLSRSLGRPPQRIPQALTLYKEVLDVYKAGLNVPEDITLVWPDDNYGYLHQLSNAAERKRTGGAGIYYHLSYWGRPHDYLWLGTTHPALIRDQLQRAWASGARKLWVVNVGDIKPLEYLTQYFLESAFDASKLDHDTQQDLTTWSAAQFGAHLAPAVSGIMRAYYDLAWERRPEFMGFGQIEPTTPNRRTAYMESGGEEAWRRLELYQVLVAQAERLASEVAPALRDAYFELVLYPVRSAANLNARILNLDLAAESARQGRASADHLVNEARKAHAALVADTAAYNSLGGGKWLHMMDMGPRNLPVFAEPVWPAYAAAPRKGCSVVYPGPYSYFADRLLFSEGHPETQVLTIVGNGAEPVEWRAAQGVRGLTLSEEAGRLDGGNGYEQRVAIRYGGIGAPSLSLHCGGAPLEVKLIHDPSAPAGVPIEHERIVTIPAAATEPHPDWEAQPALGSTGVSLRARLDLKPREPNQLAGVKPLVYEFASRTDSGAELRLVALPVHPLVGKGHVRLAFSLDHGPVELADFKTFGRSDEWKENVLSNRAVRIKVLSRLAPGHHTLRVYALDPGFVLDRIDVVFDGAPRYYGIAPLARP